MVIFIQKKGKLYLTATTQRPCFCQDLGDYEELVVPLAAAKIQFSSHATKPL